MDEERTTLNYRENGYELEITGLEAKQYRHNLLQQIASLPAQSEFDLSAVAGRNVWHDMWKAGLMDKVEAVAYYYKFPTLGNLVEVPRDYFSEPEFYRSHGLQIYQFICARYGFRPNLTADSELIVAEQNQVHQFKDQGLDVSEIDEKLGRCRLAPIRYRETRLQNSTIKKFQEAGIVTVGDYLTKASIDKMREFEISPGSLRVVRDWVKENYDVDKPSLTAAHWMHEAVKIRYSILQGLSESKSPEN